MSTKEKKVKDSIEEIVKKFSEDLKTYGCTIKDVLEQIVLKKRKDNEVFFTIGLEYRDMLYFYNQKEEWVEENIGSSESGNNTVELVKKIFVACCESENESIQFCRAITCWENQRDEINTIYYFWHVKDCVELSNLYFEAIDRSYGKWISEKLDRVRNATEYPSRLLRGKEDIKLICKQSADEFQKLMLQRFHMDLSIITKLSGSYYEGEPCKANLVFQIKTPTNERKSGIAFRETIELNEDSIRKIRKLLQMGKDNQHLLAIWNEERNRWEIDGLYTGDGTSATNIVFKIIQHMAWDMELNGKKVIGYKCGEYSAECVKFKEQEFKDFYVETFEEEQYNNVKIIFEKAVQQVHGTVLVILDKEQIESEIDRLLQNSVGIGLRDHELGTQFIDSVTSIDGAVCIDHCGKCYGIGMILDSSEKIEGHSGRGARYNSTEKYVAKCKREGKKCIAVVVSEDKSIDIFSTSRYVYKGVESCV